MSGGRVSAVATSVVIVSGPLVAVTDLTVSVVVWWWPWWPWCVRKPRQTRSVYNSWIELTYTGQIAQSISARAKFKSI